MERPNKAIKTLGRYADNNTHADEIKELLEWIEFVEDNYLCRCCSRGFKIEINKD